MERLRPFAGNLYGINLTSRTLSVRFIRFFSRPLKRSMGVCTAAGVAA